MHQRVDMTPDDLALWYRLTYHTGVYTHSYQHDREVAEKRIARYGDLLEGPLLDVGCGNGAFVDACRDAGFEAEGQDIGGSAAAHRCPLEQIDQPASFAAITMHDVLEHAVDPVGMLAAARRLLVTDGLLIVDFPDFFGQAGAHHWRPTEHLWMLTLFQLEKLVESAGLRIIERDRPIMSKFVLYAHA